MMSADVLKVGHHGSDSSSTKRFIEAVNPKYAIISVGEGNRYGHPDVATLDILRESNAEIWRTDEKGTIVVTSDGKKYSCKKYCNIYYSNNCASCFRIDRTEY